jgi:D,D-heptose 1,7-bisphosphate phosphatase
MKAVILAGGKGTRLGSLTSEIPKPMIRLGDIPLLHHQVSLLVKYGFGEIILITNYLSKPIEEYFGDGANFGAAISYFEEKEPLGTAGGIKEIKNQLTGDFFVLYGDVMINMDLSRLVRFHYAHKSQCTLVLHPNDHPFDSDLVECDDMGRILAFHSKPHKPGNWYNNLVNAGAYVFSTEILKFISKGIKADFGHDIFPSILNDIRMYGYHTSEYLKDMGTPDRLEEVRADFNSGRIKSGSYEYPQRAIFLDRDGVLNSERSYISKPEELKIFDFTASAVKKINQSGYISVVVTNQSAVARNLCTEEDIRTIHKKMETDLGNERAWLDAIYYCPHHPDKGFPEENPAYKIKCDCRKPATGMFKKAIKKFHIDPKLSYMIGDSERDMQAGRNIGSITVGVRTGYGLKKTQTPPDYMFDNLSQAVDFIVDEPYNKYFKEINRVYSGFQGKQPWVILIGGNSRTGKSILASYLRINFKRTGQEVLQVSLDNWIVAEPLRNDSMNVYDRFRLNLIESDIRHLLKGESVNVSTYTDHPQMSSSEHTYVTRNAKILIIEGVVALSSEYIRSIADYKIFTTVELKTFSQRVHKYYAWRGKTPGETDLLIQKRETDEYQLIEKESKLADLIINSAGT